MASNSAAARRPRLKHKKAPLCGHLTRQVRRGTCRACYQALFREVQAGHVTWAELEAAGRVLPPYESLLGPVRRAARQQLREKISEKKPP